MKKVFIIILFISNPLVAQTIKPLTNYSFENIIENDEASHLVLEGMHFIIFCCNRTD